MSEPESLSPTERPAEPAHMAVPWGEREAWLAAALVMLWILATTGGAALAVKFEIAERSKFATPLMAFAQAMLIFPAWWLGVRKYQASWSRLGLRGFRLQALGLGCGLIIISLLFNLLYGLFLALFHLRMQTDLTPLFQNTQQPIWLFLIGAVVAPVVEEVLFRGFMFPGLAKHYGWKWAAVLSSFMFAIGHLQLLGLPALMLLGLVFAYLYYRSGSIWPSIILHALNNACALAAVYALAHGWGQ